MIHYTTPFVQQRFNAMLAVATVKWATLRRTGIVFPGTAINDHDQQKNLAISAVP